MKIPSIDSNDNPAIYEALIVLLKLSYVFILAFGHFSPSISKPSLKILLPRNTRHLLSNRAGFAPVSSLGNSNMADETNPEENNGQELHASLHIEHFPYMGNLHIKHFPYMGKMIFFHEHS